MDEAQLLAYYDAISEEIYQLTHQEQYTERLVKDLTVAYHDCLAAGQALDQGRRQEAQDLVAAIEAELADLYMANARFQVDFTSLGSDSSLASLFPDAQRLKGSAMLRAAAKNHAGVTVIVDPADYQPVLQQLQTQKAVSGPTRFNLAVKAYGHTAQYDGAVANHLSAIAEDGSKAQLPATLTLQFERVQPMRYGENPHQFAAFYREAQPAPGTLATYHQLQGYSDRKSVV